MANSDCIQSLSALGFTELEAEVYIFLLQEAPVTGYRIAQGIGKPVANTYKAIESLHGKGAILLDEGANRLSRAVPAEELLRQLDRSFANRRASAAQALALIGKPSSDDRVYQLSTREQVMERCRSMLSRAEEIVLIDLFPAPLQELSADIAKTAARGVAIAVEAYKAAEVAGATVIVNPRGEYVMRRWPGEWLNIVVDGSEVLQSFLTSNGTGLHQAVWSGSAYLAWLYHSGLAAEMEHAAIGTLIHNGAETSELQEELTRLRWITAPENRGYRTLMERYGRK